jgi:transcriptional regulator with XRE-family HTH domain
MTTRTSQNAGVLLRDWRRRRNLSQLELASRAGVSTRHVSFVETGRSRPTPAMILRLCDELAVPLRDQNRVLYAGGFAPAHPEHRLSEPPMAEVAEAIEAILAAHLPYPALVIDPGWDLVAANDAVYATLGDVAPRLLEPPVNVIRLSLDPEGLAPRIINLDEWRGHLVARLRHEYDVSRDERIAALIDEHATASSPVEQSPGLVVPLRLRLGDDELRLWSTTTVFGTPREVTVSELAIEAFYPADAATRRLISAPASG